MTSESIVRAAPSLSRRPTNLLNAMKSDRFRENQGGMTRGNNYAAGGRMGPTRQASERNAVSLSTEDASGGVCQAAGSLPSLKTAAKTAIIHGFAAAPLAAASRIRRS